MSFAALNSDSLSLLADCGIIGPFRPQILTQQVRTMVDPCKFMEKEEILQVINFLKLRSGKSLTWKTNRIIFRLACCCGLRRIEISGLNIGDVCVSGPRPAIRLRKAITKRGKARIVPLWWDKGTLEDLAWWIEHRRSQGARDHDPFVCVHVAGLLGKRMARDLIAKRWRTAISVLPKERVKQLHIHCGRHTYCSHALAVGRTLSEVRDAAGHASVITTDIYLHALNRNRDLPDVFC